ncbi:hypothetical protein DL96DRAFT_1630014 [Flagelloscypha sp. PMI_526]|nr:hypothetical protein DL96DRAFT_1630014 [Flagelloscypha sp. PMI_526]
MVASDKILAESAADVDYYSTVRLMTQSLFYGMFFIIFIISSILLYQRNAQSTARRILFGATLFIGLATTANYALVIAGTLMQMSWPHQLSPSAPMRDKLNAGSELSRPPFAGTAVVMPLVYIVADAMPIWRAYTMWSHSKIITAILFIMLVLNVAVCFLQAVYLAVVELQDESSAAKQVQQSIVYATSLLVSVGVNALATSLIGYQAWKHRVQVREISRKSSSTLQILILLVEAGFILCVIQIVNASISISSSFIRATDPLDPLSLSTVIWTPFGDSYAAAYPSLIVIIMAYKFSVLDSVISPNSSEPRGKVTTILASMQFAEHSSSNEATDSDDGTNAERSSRKGQLTDSENGSQVAVEKV